MSVKSWLSSAVCILVAAGLIAVVAELDAASFRPGPRSRPTAGPRPAARPATPPHVKPATVPGKPLVVKPPVGPAVVVGPRVAPRRAARVIVGTAVVVRAATGPVVQPASSAAAATAEELPAVPESESAAVSSEAYKVVDVGDDYTVSVLIEGEKTPVRLLGVDPPLVAQSQDAPGRLPESALQYARNLLVGEFVTIAGDPSLAERDADGTLVAYLYRAPDNLLVNLELIRQGYALAAADYPYQHADTFTAYQEKARSDAKGVWAR